MKIYDISVVIPIYNTQPWMLKQCFDSVLNQTYRVKQIIIVDDGSTSSDTRECLFHYAEQFPQQILLHINEHGGIAKTRNTGLELAQGDFVCFLDSDDYWLSDFVEKFADRIARDTEDTDIVFCGYQMVSYDGEKKGEEYPRLNVLMNPDLFPYYSCGCGSRIYRLAHLRRYSCMFPEGCIMEDEVFSDISTLTANNISSVGSFGYCVREREDSFARYRKKFNSHTAQNIPFKQFRDCLVLAEGAAAYKRDVVTYRILHALMISSWVFCCFAPKKDRTEMAKQTAAFLREMKIDTSILKQTHKRLQESAMRLLSLNLYVLSVRLHIETLVSAIASLVTRLYYFVK